MNVQTSYTPPVLRIYSTSVNATYSIAYSVANLRTATLEIALRYQEKSSNTANASIFNV